MGSGWKSKASTQGGVLAAELRRAKKRSLRLNWKLLLLRVRRDGGPVILFFALSLGTRARIKRLLMFLG